MLQFNQRGVILPPIIPILLSVVWTSLSGVIQPGPVFAMTLAKSQRSPWAGAQIAIGHAIIEVPLILLIYFGFGQFFENPVVQVVLSILGGGMIVWLGIGMFRSRVEVAGEGKDLPYNAVVAGIITTGLNPFFLLWWATVGIMLVMKFHEFGTVGLVSFIFTHWLCDLGWLSLVSVLVYNTRKIWGRKFREWVFIICSLGLIGFGGWFIISGIQTML